MKAIELVKIKLLIVIIALTITTFYTATSVTIYF